ncbi:MAG: formyltransferase family protein [Desulfobaccales bacterium]
MNQNPAKKWVVITSTETRHRFLANVLAATGMVYAVVAEPKKRRPGVVYDNEEDGRLLAQYFADRDRAEEIILGQGQKWELPSRCPLTITSTGGVNDPQIATHLRTQKGITHGVVFGTWSILRKPWFDNFGGNLVNLHLGLSPYYRGAGTNFWALSDGNPHLVGATIHVLDEDVDTGPIYQHVRPIPEIRDTVHTFFNKVIEKSARSLSYLMTHLAEFTPVPQWSTDMGREYKRKEFNAEALRGLLKILDEGVLVHYARNPQAPEYAVKLVREFEPVGVKFDG